MRISLLCHGTDEASYPFTPQRQCHTVSKIKSPKGPGLTRPACPRAFPRSRLGAQISGYSKEAANARPRTWTWSPTISVSVGTTSTFIICWVFWKFGVQDRVHIDVNNV
jgi:hypothetical protein